jgi:hypothetical protein
MNNYTCFKCGPTPNVYTQEKGTQIGLYCGKCHKWIKWLSKEEKNALQEPKPVENTFENLCKQISDYILENYNPMTAVLITDSEIKIVENIEGFPINRG